MENASSRPWREEQRDGDLPRGERIGALLALPAGHGPEELPSVADVDDYGELGMSRALYGRGEHDPYVPRPWLDDALDAAMREREFVLLAGKSKAGRWRSAIEAVRRTLPDARLLIPRPGTAALAALLDLDPPLRVGDAPVVVWLDELERYLGAADGIDLDLLARLRNLAQRVVVVATIQPDVPIRQSLLTAEGELGPAARLVLDQATTIIVPSPTGPEPDEDSQPPNPERSVEGAGARSLERRFRDGYHGDGIVRVGWALTRAAIDWCRVGMYRAISEPELRELSRAYLPARGPSANPDDTAWAAGLRWALTRPPGAPAALLAEQRSDRAMRTFQALDHIVSYADEMDDSEIPPDAWAFAMRRSDTLDLMGVAVTAQRRERREVAEQAWHQLAKAGEPVGVAAAGLMLGQALTDRGDPVAAIAAYEQAIAAGGDPGVVVQAHVNLGQLLQKQGDLDRAIAVYRRAIALDQPVGTPLAAMNLGGLLRKHGDLAGARSAYEQALAALTGLGDPDGMFHGMAAHDLGTLLVEQGQVASAIRAFKVAIASKHPTAAPRAASVLGALLIGQGDNAGAVEALRLAATSDERNVAAAAELELAMMREDSDPAAAAEVYRDLAADEVPVVSPTAMLRLGNLLMRQGDPDGARAAFQRGAESDVLDTAPWAALDLGQALMDGGDLAGAEAAYRQAVRSGRRNVVPRAELRLGVLLKQRGDLTSARAAYQRAIDSGHTDAAPVASYNLGGLLRADGDLAGMRAAYQRAIDSGHADAAPPAAYNLALALDKQGDLAGARAAFQSAADSGHPQLAPLAMVYLGDVLMDLRDVEGARVAFQRASRSGNPDAVNQARERLDRLGH